MSSGDAVVSLDFRQPERVVEALLLVDRTREHPGGGGQVAGLAHRHKLDIRLPDCRSASSGFRRRSAIHCGIHRKLGMNQAQTGFLGAPPPGCVVPILASLKRPRIASSTASIESIGRTIGSPEPLTQVVHRITPSSTGQRADQCDTRHQPRIGDSPRRPAGVPRSPGLAPGLPPSRSIAGADPVASAASAPRRGRDRLCRLASKTGVACSATSSTSCATSESTCIRAQCARSARRPRPRPPQLRPRPPRDRRVGSNGSQASSSTLHVEEHFASGAPAASERRGPLEQG